MVVHPQRATRGAQYKQIQSDLKKHLNSDGWDGRWFKRAYFDDGTPLGSNQNEECRIDNISQSWAVISKAGDNDKQYICMESAKNNLVDEANGIIKLLDPPFNTSNIEPGYIKSYLPGIRENGGQYTHSAAWMIMAFAKLGFADEALKYLSMRNPINHSRTREHANIYKVEPYVIPADIYSQANLAGRGGWTWYTGAASWIYKVYLEDILGLKITDNKLTIKPCVPKEWKEYSIEYMYQETQYNITVNPVGATCGRPDQQNDRNSSTQNHTRQQLNETTTYITKKRQNKT